MKQRTSTLEDYRKRVNIVVDYIYSHLDDDFDLEKLAELSCFSKWHFQRMMKAWLGESVGAFICRTRLEMAAKLLRSSQTPVGEIAYQVGYDVPSSLSKAFKLFYNISPSEYRNNKNLMIMKSFEVNDFLKLKAPKTLVLEPKQAIYVTLRGDYATLDYGKAWKCLWQFVKENRLFSAGIEHVAVYYNDPEVTAPEKLRTDLCLVLPKRAEPRGAVGVTSVFGGKYAKFVYVGAYEGLGAVYDAIYARWLPESGEKLRNCPCLEKYLNNPERTKPDKLRTEIYLPIE
jgi:AraC family transcriptional regulator